MEGKHMIEKTGMIETWLRKHTLLYTGATRHPFLLSIRDGTIDLSSFKKWLGQNIIVFRALVPFVASVLVKAWKESDDKSDVDMLLNIMASMNHENSCFKEEASKWRVSLTSVVPEKAILEYCSFLESLMNSEVEYAVALTVFGIMETAFYEGFAHCLENGTKIPEELTEFCQRYGSDGFRHQCQSLQNAANRLLEKAPNEVRSKAEVNLVKGLEHEIELWNISRREV
ncbi:hypothetical protein DCAR_0935405 [Daucus carota subsp. sativus]|uniref:Thiaminase-2/PQQC domain-containing protein n=1 Tax=Daucus carota subsp. sativus TaxID=79200 RepID=A0A175YI82_DAUCS|nr:PREDICTED: probable bifunctional TENA-E protein [Daucus carota subsp. sativus]WOH15859.1 hypothetical protein DCAR_0935405 [Daucus carota subsp. sativus]